MKTSATKTCKFGNNQCITYQNAHNKYDFAKYSDSQKEERNLFAEMSLSCLSKSTYFEPND